MPSRFNIPNTGVLFAAPLPLLPLTLLAPFCSQLRVKRSKSSFRLFQSEASRRACELEISPENLDIFSHSLDIKILIFLVILLIVFSEISVNSAIFTASISAEKYHRISLNFFSEIRELLTCKFSKFNHFQVSYFKFKAKFSLPALLNLS